MTRFFSRSFVSFLHICVLISLAATLCTAQTKSADPNPDVLVLNNGDTLHG